MMGDELAQVSDILVFLRDGETFTSLDGCELVICSERDPEIHGDPRLRDFSSTRRIDLSKLVARAVTEGWLNEVDLSVPLLG